MGHLCCITDAERDEALRRRHALEQAEYDLEAVAKLPASVRDEIVSHFDGADTDVDGCICSVTDVMGIVGIVVFFILLNALPILLAFAATPIRHFFMGIADTPLIHFVMAITDTQIFQYLMTCVKGALITAVSLLVYSCVLCSLSIPERTMFLICMGCAIYAGPIWTRVWIVFGPYAVQGATNGIRLTKQAIDECFDRD
jgi:hypothetical protein